ncbi:MAG: YdbL family protein [Sterolibacterium sp.]|nr:YdbL family protein [Sterolibacterium sp.]
MNHLIKLLRQSLLLAAMAASVMIASPALAQANLEANTPVITQLKASMHGRHSQLAPHLASGAVGLTRDGAMQLRDATAVPLAQRQAVNGLVAAENADRAALYREIARANNKPEWEGEIRATFAQRWSDRAPAGWWIQDNSGNWMQK